MNPLLLNIISLNDMVMDLITCYYYRYRTYVLTQMSSFVMYVNGLCAILLYRIFVEISIFAYMYHVALVSHDYIRDS